MLEELGSGAGGTVYKALHAASLRLVIVVSAKTSRRSQGCDLRKPCSLNRYVAVKKIKLDDHVKNEQVLNFNALSRYSSVGLVQEIMV